MMPQKAKKPPKANALADAILKNFALRVAHIKAFRTFDINLDVIMPENTQGLRVDLFARHVLGKPTITPDALKEKFGEKAREVAVIVNNFITEKICLKDLPKPTPPEKKNKKEVVEVVEKPPEEEMSLFEEDEG